MNKFLIYILEVSFVFAFLYLVFYLFFRKLKFHKANRSLLLFLLPLSLLIPVLEFEIQVDVPQEIRIPEFNEILVDTYQTIENKQIKENVINFQYFLFLLYLIGFAISLANLVQTTVNIFHLKNKSVYYQIDNYLFIKLQTSSIFSFFNWIFIPENYNFSYEDPIIEHEKAHVQMGHTFDLIFTELFIALLWFNPFVYFFRKTIRELHEFQADKMVLKSGVKKSQYLKLMLNQLENQQTVRLYNYFNGLTINNRVKMITINKSKNREWLKYLLFLPLVGLLIMAFAERQNTTSAIFKKQLDENKSASITKKNIDKKSFIFPLHKNENIRLSSRYGKRFNPILKKEDFHKGVDIVAPLGTNVYASAEGEVMKLVKSGGWGNLVIIKHADGYETWYAHLKDFAVQQADYVKQGDLIGFVGNTGLSTAPHLHFEIKVNNENVNPEDYLE